MSERNEPQSKCRCCGYRPPADRRTLCAACLEMNCAPWSHCSVPMGYDDELPPVESDLERIRLELERWPGPMTRDDYDRLMGW